MSGRAIPCFGPVVLALCLLGLFLVVGEMEASADWLSAGTTIPVGFRIDGLAAVLLLVGTALGLRSPLPARGAFAGVILAGDPFMLLAFWILLGLAARSGRPAGSLGSGAVLVAVLLLALPMRSIGAWSDVGALLLVLGVTARISGTLVGQSRRDTGIVAVAGLYVVLRLMPLFLDEPARLAMLGGVGVVILGLLAGMERWRLRVRRPGATLVRPFEDLDRAMSRGAATFLSGALEDLGDIVSRVLTVGRSR